jgi:hypothetical protein
MALKQETPQVEGFFYTLSGTLIVFLLDIVPERVYFILGAQDNHKCFD